MKPLSKVKIKWSPDFAYAIGLLVADGSLSKDGRHIDFTSKEKDQIITFQKCLGIEDIKIGEKRGKNKKISFRVQFGDVLFYRWLIEIGIIPNKSKTLGPLNIPDKFFFDFLRGCFDGDGCIYSFLDKRWPNSFMFYLVFASASQDFIVWLQQKIKILANVNGIIDKNTYGIIVLKFAKTETIALYPKMFYSNDVPCLERKLIKAQKIFKENKLRPGGGMVYTAA